MTPIDYRTPELDMLQQIDRKQDRLIERLFGDLDEENDKARLPALESTTSKNTVRIQQLENDRTRIYTLGAVVGAIGGWLGQWLIHHG